MKILKDMLLIIVLAAVTGLVVNSLSPRGITLMGDWDPSKGVVSANPKDRPVARDIEIRSVQEASTLFKDTSVLFVDAREETLFNEGHIQGAVSLFVYDYNKNFAAFMARYPKDQPIVTYCSGRECEDSHTLARYLKEDGYTHVRVFVDGYPAWAEEGLPVEKTE